MHFTNKQTDGQQLHLYSYTVLLTTAPILAHDKTGVSWL